MDVRVGSVLSVDDVISSDPLNAPSADLSAAACIKYYITDATASRLALSASAIRPLSVSCSAGC